MTAASATPTPPAPPPPPPGDVPPEVLALVTKIANEAVTAANAARDAAAAQRPSTTITNIRDLQMDAPEGRLWEARAGIAIKSAYLQRAKALGVTTQGEPALQRGFKDMEAYLLKCKSVGQFASLFGSGGEKLPVVESSEIIEYLRPASLLLGRPGLRKVSGYGGKFVIGKLNEVPSFYWVAEGQTAPKSKVDGGLLELGGHKGAGLARISNDLLRRGDSEASANVGAELQTSAALAIDRAGFFGKGNKTPRGLLDQIDKAMVSDASGTTLQNKIDDLNALPAALEDKDVALDDSGFYFMAPKTFWGLRGARDTGGWVFAGLQDLKNPTHNGYPVVRGTVLNGLGMLGFGLASQYYFGSAAEMSVTLGENASDFAEDMMTARLIAYADWLLRHNVAFALKKGVTY